MTSGYRTGQDRSIRLPPMKEFQLASTALKRGRLDLSYSCPQPLEEWCISSFITGMSTSVSIREPLSPLPLTSLLPTGRDEASSVEVTWPDGKMVSRSVASRELNSVLQIPYPRDEDKLQDPAPLEVGQGIWIRFPENQASATTHRPVE